ncbi:MAG: ATP-binding protein [Gammaproteobacteria bacterium]|nr:MAG: ATP-binding protein [Gammaproteobacteria bacterium]
MELLELFKNHRAVAVLNGKPIGVKRVNIPPLEDFVGVERQKELLVKNTLALLEERPFNDVLLWGKRGTGKSSLVRAMLNLSPKLKLLQVDKEEVGFLIEFFNLAWELTEFKFIVLVDDLSVLTEEGKTIRILKTLLEGSVFERPPNVAIYATSNRRNLTPETFLERDYKFPREELEERLSLVDRFGLKIGFTNFSPDDYLLAVKLYCKKLGINFDEKVREKALAYAREKDFSGRSAYQFVRFYASLQINPP